MFTCYKLAAGLAAAPTWLLYHSPDDIVLLLVPDTWRHRWTFITESAVPAAGGHGLGLARVWSWALILSPHHGQGGAGSSKLRYLSVLC